MQRFGSDVAAMWQRSAAIPSGTMYCLKLMQIAAAVIGIAAKSRLLGCKSLYMLLRMR
jgi:hypothetical protein